MRKNKIERCLGIIIIAVGLAIATNNVSISDKEEIPVITVEADSQGVSAGVSATMMEYLDETDTVIVEEETVEVTAAAPSEQTDTEDEEISYMYPNCYKINIRNTPSTDSDESIIDTVTYETKLEVIGAPDKNGWVKVNLNGSTAYVLYELLSDEMIEIEDAYVYNGTKLNETNGHVSGPSGVETYYNMDMSWCVGRMHRLGYEGEYWVREDGVKMFGDYVMVAANFSIRPLGTVLPTSLGMGIVVDTGGFVRNRAHGLDIAVTW